MKPSFISLVVLLLLLVHLGPAQFGNPSGPTTLATPAGPGADCPDVPDAWEVLQGVTEAEHASAVPVFRSSGYRPISISVNVTTDGVTEKDRWSSIWIKDQRTPWRFVKGLESPDVAAEIAANWAEGFHPVAIDAYGERAAFSKLKYAIIFVRNKGMVWHETRGKLAPHIENLLAAAPTGWRPLWISGHEDIGDGRGPRYAAIFVRDGIQGAADLSLSWDELKSDVGRARVDDGFRLVHLSGFDTPEGRRYAATWIKENTNCPISWESFRSKDFVDTRVKTISQFATTKTVAIPAGSNTLTLTEADMLKKSFVMPGLQPRVARLRLDPAGGGTTEIRDVAFSAGGPQDGDMLVLEVNHGELVRIAEDVSNGLEPFQGNIRLKPTIGWDFATSDYTALAAGFTLAVPGQPFDMSSYHHQLVIEYEGSSDTWFEVKRNSISHGEYWPISLDEHGVTSASPSGTEGRAYAAVWMEARDDRAFRIRNLGASVIGGLATPSALDAFDDIMKEYMQDRKIPGGALGIAVDGNLVLARGYTFEPSETADVRPDDMFRLGSISKTITGAAATKLEDDGMIALSNPLHVIPGVDAVLNSAGWADPAILNVTPKRMLHHLSGLRRDKFGNYFEICSELGLGANPITYQQYIDHMGHAWFSNGSPVATFTSVPGTRHAYSNEAYRMMTLPIMVASGMSYEDYCRSVLFDPIGADRTWMRPVGANDHLVHFFTANNDMKADNGGWEPGYGWPGRDLCNENHANNMERTMRQGGISDAANAAGAWKTTVVDMTRFLKAIRNDELMTSAARRRFLSRPEGRSVKFLRFEGSDGSWADHSFDTRFSSLGQNVEVDIDPIDALYFGNGYQTFSSIDFDISLGGWGYSLQWEYFSSDGVWKTLAVSDDETSGFTQFSPSVVVRFTPPSDWVACGVGPNAQHVRYWVRVRTGTTPTTNARFSRVSIAGEVDYARGVDIGTVYESRLPFTGLASSFGAGDLVVGADSKASGTVLQVASNPNGTGYLILEDVRGGPFSSGELLASDTGGAATASDRDRPHRATFQHNGAYEGCIAQFRSRGDGVDFVYFFNWSREDAFYHRGAMRDGRTLLNAVNDTVTAIESANLWPTWNLFGL